MRSPRAALLAAALLVAGSLGACKRHQDPLTPRARAPMTQTEVLDASATPLPEQTSPEQERVRVTMTALRAVVGFWRLEAPNRGRCPSLRDLTASPSSGFDPNTMTRDPWGSPFEVDCLGGVVRLRSLGPDRQPETADDVIRY